MNTLIKRNAPVFIIGFFTVLVFIAITIASVGSDDESTIPQLTKVREDPDTPMPDDPQPQQRIQPKEKIDRSKITATEGYLSPEARAELEETKRVLAEITMTPEEVQAKYGTLQIAYTEEGFEPKSATAYNFQRVTWTNETDEPITFGQVHPKYDEWEEDRTLAPGETTEFELYEENLWTYREHESRNYGTIYSKRPYR